MSGLPDPTNTAGAVPPFSPGGNPPAGGGGGSTSGSNASWLQNVGSAIFGAITDPNTLGALGSAALVEKTLDDLRDAGKYAVRGAGEIGTTAQADAQFKPFTVTTGTGDTLTTTPEGGYNVGLGDRQKSFQTNLFNKFAKDVNPYGRPNLQLTGASDRGYDPVYAKAMQGTKSLFDPVLQNPETRSQAIYELLRQTQIPDEQRQQALLDESLVNRGRQGMRTAMFGGTPEQLAMNKALQETQADTRLKAMQMARAERADDLGTQRQLFDLSGAALAAPEAVKAAQLQNLTGMLGLGYTPSQMAMGAIPAATDIASIVDTGRRQGAGYVADTGIAGLQGMLQSEAARANLLGEIFTEILGGTMGGSGGTGSGTNHLKDVACAVLGKPGWLGC